jgi:predicted DsbA family dithiol-disulfide isomerase
LDLPRFEQCLDGDTRAVDEDVAEARRAGVTSTPTFAIGLIQRDGSVAVTSRIRGAQPTITFRTIIEGMLRSPVSKL